MQYKVEISPVSVLKFFFSLTPSAFLICRYYTSCRDNPLLINRALTAGKERRETVRVIIQPQLLWSVSGTVPTHWNNLLPVRSHGQNDRDGDTRL